MSLLLLLPLPLLLQLVLLQVVVLVLLKVLFKSSSSVLSTFPFTSLIVPTKPKVIFVWLLPYVKLLATLKSMSELVTAGTWTHQIVANDDIIEIFMSKSAYFKNHSKVFTMVNRHPQMKKWLLNADDGPSDYDVWGYRKHTFDVSKAILTPMPPPPVDIKGKGKEEVNLDLSSPLVEKRKKKGAAKTVGKKEKKRADYNDKKDKKKGEGSGKASTSKAHLVLK